MSKLLYYFNELKTTNKKTFQILDDLIDLFYFNITNDSVAYDVRKINLHNNHNSLIIKSKFILNNNFEKLEFIEINFLNKIFSYLVSY